MDQQIRVTALATCKKLLRARGAAAEKAFLARLTPASQKSYRNLASLEFLPLEQHVEMLTATAEVLYPDVPQPVLRLGREAAREMLGGVFKQLLILPTMSYLFQHSLQILKEPDQASASVRDFSTASFVLERVPQVWHTFYNRGELTVENLTATSGLLVVHGLPEMHPVSREFTRGFMLSLLELAGARQVRVEQDDSDPQAWKWSMSWE